MAKRVTNDPGVEFGIYLDVISKANSTVFKEAYRMNTATFQEVFTEAGIIPEWMARGEAKGIVKGIAKGKAEVARNALAEGATIEFVQRITGLDREQILNE